LEPLYNEIYGKTVFLNFIDINNFLWLLVEPNHTIIVEIHKLSKKTKIIFESMDSILRNIPKYVQNEIIVHSFNFY